MKRILIIDDDVDTLEVLKFFLESNGFEVITSSDGKIGVNEVVSYSPQIILLDVYLKGGNGVEICNQLKSNNLTRHIPIIMSSAQTTDYLILRKCAAEDFISKPIDTNSLMVKINHLTKVSQQTQKPAPSEG